VEAGEIMSRICKEAERSMDALANYEGIKKALEGVSKKVNESICHAAVNVAFDSKVKAILALTKSGYTARQIAKYRPPMPVVAVTPHDVVRRQLAVVRGVFALQASASFEGSSSVEVINEAVQKAVEAGLLVEGDCVTVVHGTPENRDRDGFSNLVKIVTVESVDE